MKLSTYIAAGLFILSTPTLHADDTSTTTTAGTSEDAIPYRLSQLPMHLNTQLGVSSLGYSNEGAGKSKLGGGATLEFGDGAYRAEVGALFLQKSSSATFQNQTDPTTVETSLLALPLLAKFRVYQSTAQSWALKLGVIQTFELSSNKAEATIKIDTLGAVGVSGRLAFTRRADFIVDATYNRGLIPALRSNHADAYNEGVLVLAGLSFRL